MVKIHILDVIYSAIVRKGGKYERRGKNRKRDFIKNKEIDLKIKEIDSIIKYFLKNNMIDKLKETLLANNLDIVDLRGITDETIKENQKESKTSDN